MALYLLHSTVPLHRAGTRAVQHYIGYCADRSVTKRVHEHRVGKSQAAIIRAFRALGAQLILARVWAGATREDERRIKIAGHLGELCPVCTPEKSLTGDVGQWRQRRPRK
jgi:hypothetical protein